MNFKKSIFLTFIIQIIGVILTSLSKIIVSRKFGPEGQGYYSYFLSAIVLISGFGLFGFPQSFLFLMNSRKISAEWTKSFSLFYATFLLLLLPFLFLVLRLLGLLNLSYQEILVLITSSVITIFCGICRVISLSNNSIFLYNLINITSNVALVFLLVISPVIDYSILLLPIVISNLISGIFSFLVLGFSIEHIKDILRVGFIQDSVRKINLSIEYSLWAFLPSLAISLSTIITYEVLKRAGGSNLDVGYFSTSVLIISLGLMPFNIISPILFNFWSKQPNKVIVFNLSKKLSDIGFWIMIIITILGIAFAKQVIQLVFGKLFYPSVLSTQILLLSLSWVYKTKITQSLLLSIGEPKIIAFGELLRASAIILMMNFDFFKSPIGASSVWVLADILNMTYTSLSCSYLSKKYLGSENLHIAS